MQNWVVELNSNLNGIVSKGIIPQSGELSIPNNDNFRGLVAMFTDSTRYGLAYFCDGAGVMLTKTNDFNVTIESYKIINNDSLRTVRWFMIKKQF